MLTKPLPCPFCSGTRLRAVELPNYDATPSGNYAVVCDGCGAHGPDGQSEDEALKAWGRRPEMLTTT